MIFRSTSKKPIVIVGNGCREAGAAEVLHAFYEKTKIPVLTTMNAVDLMQDEDKLGFIGVYGHRVANMIVSQCDLVISIGARLGLRQIGNKKEYFAPNAHLIRADIDQYELSRNIKEDEEKHLIDAKEFLLKLLDEDIPKYTEWNKACFEAKVLLDPYDKDLGNLCIEKISSMLPENPIVAIDIGQAQCWSAQSLTLKGHEGRILIGGSYGSMGCGLPYAIGATIAEGKKTVYCITGDGGLQMNIQELQTVVEFDLDHSSSDETRYRGTFSWNDNYLFIVYTIRGDAVRIISARLATKDEIRHYYKRMGTTADVRTRLSTECERYN